MLYSPAFIFPSVYPLGLGFLAGLRLLALRQFSAFFASSASPRWRTAFSRFARVVKLGFQFWSLWLTGQSSRPAFGGR
ncbi:DUF1010 domain-containing protein, partial [Acidovorax sp. T1m]|uniref:DUF1010 domain-containing protein n=1 Tax=Acidovorax sp. T1m TaxID=2006116 RepID=UPI0018E9A777